jgi:hypothetical protein
MTAGSTGVMPLDVLDACARCQTSITDLSRRMPSPS